MDLPWYVREGMLGQGQVRTVPTFGRAELNGLFDAVATAFQGWPVGQSTILAELDSVLQVWAANPSNGPLSRPHWFGTGTSSTRLSFGLDPKSITLDSAPTVPAGSRPGPTASRQDGAVTSSTREPLPDQRTLKTRLRGVIPLLGTNLVLGRLAPVKITSSRQGTAHTSTSTEDRSGSRAVAGPEQRVTAEITVRIEHIGNPKSSDRTVDLRLPKRFGLSFPQTNPISRATAGSMQVANPSALDSFQHSVNAASLVGLSGSVFDLLAKAGLRDADLLSARRQLESELTEQWFVDHSEWLTSGGSRVTGLFTVQPPASTGSAVLPQRLKPGPVQGFLRIGAQLATLNSRGEAVMSVSSETGHSASYQVGRSQVERAGVRLAAPVDGVSRLIPPVVSVKFLADSSFSTAALDEGQQSIMLTRNEVQRQYAATFSLTLELVMSSKGQATPAVTTPNGNTLIVVDLNVPSVEADAFERLAVSAPPSPVPTSPGSPGSAGSAGSGGGMGSVAAPAAGHGKVPPTGGSGTFGSSSIRRIRHTVQQNSFSSPSGTPTIGRRLQVTDLVAIAEKSMPIQVEVAPAVLAAARKAAWFTALLAHDMVQVVDSTGKPVPATPGAAPPPYSKPARYRYVVSPRQGSTRFTVEGPKAPRRPPVVQLPWYATVQRMQGAHEVEKRASALIEQHLAGLPETVSVGDRFGLESTLHNKVGLSALRASSHRAFGPGGVVFTKRFGPSKQYELVVGVHGTLDNFIGDRRKDAVTREMLLSSAHQMQVEEGAAAGAAANVAGMLGGGEASGDGGGHLSVSPGIGGELGLHHLTTANAGAGVTGYRRELTTASVRELTFSTTWTLVVGVHDRETGFASSSLAVLSSGGPDKRRYLTTLAVPEEYLPAGDPRQMKLAFTTPTTMQPRLDVPDNFSQVPTYSPLLQQYVDTHPRSRDGEEVGKLGRFVPAGLPGRAWFTGLGGLIPEVSALVGQGGDLEEIDKDGEVPLGAPPEISQEYMSSHFDQLTSDEGMPVRLPDTADGEHQALVIQLRLYGGTLVRPLDGTTYQVSLAAWSLLGGSRGGTTGAAVRGHLDGSAHVPAGTVLDGSEVSASMSPNASRRLGTALSTQSDGTSTVEATYSGEISQYSFDAVYLVGRIRWRDGVSTMDQVWRHLRPQPGTWTRFLLPIPDGVTLPLPHRVALAHGLPTGQAVAGAPQAPLQQLGYLAPDLPPSVGFPEQLLAYDNPPAAGSGSQGSPSPQGSSQAQGSSTGQPVPADRMVRRAIRQAVLTGLKEPQLNSLKVPPNALERGAFNELDSTYRKDALYGRLGDLLSTGIPHLSIVPASNGTLRIGTLVTAKAAVGTFVGPRPDARVGTGRNTSAATGKEATAQIATGGEAVLDGLGVLNASDLAGTGYDAGAGYGGGGQASLGQVSTAGLAQTVTGRDSQTAADGLTSAEFSHDLTFHVQVTLEFVPEAIEGAAKRVTALVTRNATVGQPPTTTKYASFQGSVNVLVPAHLTAPLGHVLRPVERTVPVAGALRAGVVPGSALQGYVIPLAMPGLRKIAQRIVDAVQATTPSRSFSPATQDGFNLSIALAEPASLSRFGRLLGSGMPIPLSGNASLTVRVEVFGIHEVSAGEAAARMSTQRAHGLAPSAGGQQPGYAGGQYVGIPPDAAGLAASLRPFTDVVAGSILEAGHPPLADVEPGAQFVYCILDVDYVVAGTGFASTPSGRFGGTVLGMLPRQVFDSLADLHPALVHSSLDTWSENTVLAVTYPVVVGGPELVPPPPPAPEAWWK